MKKVFVSLFGLALLGCGQAPVEEAPVPTPAEEIIPAEPAPVEPVVIPTEEVVPTPTEEVEVAPEEVPAEETAE